MDNIIIKQPIDRKYDLLTAAADIFVEKGLHDTKISDIVARAGVAQGTFYLYFKNKTDIFLTLLNECCGDILLKLKESSEQRTEIKSAQQLKEHNFRFLTNLFTMLESKHNAIKLILASPVGEKSEVNEALHILRNSLVEITKENLDAGIKAGYVRQMDSRIVAEAIVGMVYSMAFERLVYKKNSDIEIKKLCKEIVDFEMFGITNDQLRGDRDD